MNDEQEIIKVDKTALTDHFAEMELTQLGVRNIIARTGKKESEISSDEAFDEIYQPMEGQFDDEGQQLYGMKPEYQEEFEAIYDGIEQTIEDFKVE